MVRVKDGTSWVLSLVHKGRITHHLVKPNDEGTSLISTHLHSSLIHVELTRCFTNRQPTRFSSVQPKADLLAKDTMCNRASAVQSATPNSNDE
jgi:hypothetical protein